MTYETLLTERRGAYEGILWLTLNRPEKLNAISMTMFGELHDVFREARTDRSIRCIVITGAGRGFCAGADASGSAARAQGAPAEPPPLDLEGERLFFRKESEAYLALRGRIHALALDERGRVVADSEFRDLRKWVVSVWAEVFAGVDDGGDSGASGDATAGPPADQSTRPLIWRGAVSWRNATSTSLASRPTTRS